VSSSAWSVVSADSASRKDELSAWVPESRPVSRHSLTLKQIDGVSVPPSGHQCSVCGITENLWLNLTDGQIHCGRKNWDGTGGNGHALAHFQQFRYPLAVKLGTISGSGQADVFSYDEDDMVEDPLLATHLLKFGISMDAMVKTEKTVAELELEQNMSYEWSRLQESGADLVPVEGAGFLGLKNMGNTCYMNSILQVLMAIPSIRTRYAESADAAFGAIPLLDLNTDLEAQLCKLARFVSHGGPIDENEPAATPRLLKGIIGKGHPEFSTMRQQDAAEFFQYMLDLIEKRPGGGPDPCALFKFVVEERVECSASHAVLYRRREENIVGIPIDLGDAINADEVSQWEKRRDGLFGPEAAKLAKEKVVRRVIPFDSAVVALSKVETIDNFFSAKAGFRTMGLKTTRFATFPPYLMLQIRKFAFAANWAPMKLDVAMAPPHELDLTHMRGRGPQPGEELQPDEQKKTTCPEADEGIVAAIVGMGFSENAAKRAALAVKNSTTEAAADWLFGHMDEPSINEPLESPVASASDGVDDESVAMIVSMGFDSSAARRALRVKKNNVEVALEWLLTGGLDEAEEVILQPVPVTAPAGSAAGTALLDGVGRYRLKAIVSHMGSSAASGHYVCHIRVEDKWVIFNDDKIAESKNPPFDLGYLYLYERM
jgi:ubiquitin carboxyl-terminal hydrolase 5/13